MSQAALVALTGYESYLGREVGVVASELARFVQLLESWQKIQNLVSRETLVDIWSRHIRDSLQLLPFLEGTEQRMLDLGSGGGFPCVPLAIALKTVEKNSKDGREHTLIEANRRKVSFLRTVSRELELGLLVLPERFENVTPAEVGDIDLITSRATAPLGALFGHMQQFWGGQTRALLHKGADYRVEIAKCDAKWASDMIVSPSVTDPNGVILDVRNLAIKSL